MKTFQENCKTQSCNYLTRHKAAGKYKETMSLDLQRKIKDKALRMFSDDFRVITTLHSCSVAGLEEGVFMLVSC